MHHIACFDIAHNRRRRQVVRLLEGHGQRLHESAFMLRLRPAQLGQLQKQLLRLLHLQQDRLTLYPCCERDHPDRLELGAQPLGELPQDWQI
jgi:CRISPR-associated endonuclease Cas2